MIFFTRFTVAALLVAIRLGAAEARHHRRWYELSLPQRQPVAKLTVAPRKPPRPDFVTGVAEKILRGPAAHVTLLGALTFDRIDPWSCGLVGTEWKF